MVETMVIGDIELNASTLCPGKPTFQAAVTNKISSLLSITFDDTVLITFSTLVGLILSAIFQSNMRYSQSGILNPDRFPMASYLLLFPLVQAFSPLYFSRTSIVSLVICWIFSSVVTILGIIYLPELRSHQVLIFIELVFCFFTTWKLKQLTLLIPKNNIQRPATDIDLNVLSQKFDESLVHQILPASVAHQIRSGRPVPPEQFDNVTIFFSDIEGFTKICASVDQLLIVELLNNVYTIMDYCCSLFPIYKVETIGDAYMVAGGLSSEEDDLHYQYIANFALLVQATVGLVKSPLDGSPIKLRIGIHTGKVIAGVVGSLMPRYCLFGDTVNTASRMESTGETGKIQCSEVTAKLLEKSGLFWFQERGEIDVKGKGLMTTFWLLRASNLNTASNKTAMLKVTRNVQDLLATSSGNFLSRPSASLKSSTFLVADALHADASKAIALPKLISKIDQYSLTASLKSRQLRILVVEDCPVQRKVIVKLLNIACPDWFVNSAKDGEAALEKLKAFNFMFDVIIIDENLSSDGSRLNGREFVRIVRSYLGMHNCVVIDCSADIRQDNQYKGVDKIWSKPPPASNLVLKDIQDLVAWKLKHSF